MLAASWAYANQVVLEDVLAAAVYTGDLQRYSLCFVSPWSGLELSGATAIGSIHIVKTSHHSTWLHLRGIQLCRSALFLTQEWILQMDFACPEQFLPSRLKKKSATAKRHWLLCQVDHRPVSKPAMPIWSECSRYHLLIKKWLQPMYPMQLQTWHANQKTRRICQQRFLVSRREDLLLSYCPFIFWGSYGKTFALAHCRQTP